MTTLIDVYSSTDMLYSNKDESMPLFWSHEDAADTYALVQPDGCIEYVFDENAVVEAFVNGSVSIDGINFTAYVTQQVKFNPDQE